MKLHSLKFLLVRNYGTGDGVRPSRSAKVFRGSAAAGVLCLGLCQLFPHGSAFSQQARMVIDGTIRSEGTRLPSTTKIRILHADGSVDRTVEFYDPQSYRFGIRLSSHDGFVEDEKILFRIVVAARDSFMARFVGPPLVFKGTKETLSAPTTKIELFRNDPPTVYRSMPDTTINEGQLLRYRLVAVDRNADTVRFSLANSPPGASVDPITGMFVWKPSFEQAGTYGIGFLISDGFDTDDSRIARIVVRDVDRPPQFFTFLPDTSVKEGDTLRFTLKASDPDSDDIVYRTVHAPEGLKIDSLAGTIVWTPTYDQAGNYLSRFLASDGSLSDTSTTTRITVLNVNRPPVFSSVLADTTISEDQVLRCQWNGSDPDSDNTWFSLKQGPEGLTVDSLGFMMWRPTFAQAGSYRILVSLHDQDLSSDTVVTIHVRNKDRTPLAFSLQRPSQNDTVRLVLSTPIRFLWNRSFDPDADDTLRYTLHVWGPKLDTMIHGQSDTTILASIKPWLQPLSIYRWNVNVTDGTISVSSADTLSFKTSAGITGSAELLSQIPKNFDLEQSLPDPFNPMTTIRYALPERSYVKLTIFNMMGESLLVLVSGEKDAGVYDVTFDASDFTSGAYMFRLDAHPLGGNQAKDFVNTKKMFIVR